MYNDGSSALSLLVLVVGLAVNKYPALSFDQVAVAAHFFHGAFGFERSERGQLHCRKNRAAHGKRRHGHAETRKRPGHHRGYSEHLKELGEKNVWSRYYYGWKGGTGVH